jgi:hypothetical protein
MSAVISNFFVKIDYILKKNTGNALERVQWVHAPADLWDITICTRRILTEILKYSKNSRHNHFFKRKITAKIYLALRAYVY